MHVRAKWISRAPCKLIRLGLYADVGHELLTKQEAPQTQKPDCVYMPAAVGWGMQPLLQHWRVSVPQDVSPTRQELKSRLLESLHA